METRRYFYTLTGNKEFPTSALTTDQCWPADLDSALEIGRSWCNPIQKRTIRLVGLKEPTVRLWLALGYKVENS